MTFRTLLVMDTEPDFSTPPQVTPMTNAMRVDLSEARGIAAFPERLPLRVLRHTYAVSPRSNITALLSFIKAHAGKWGNFWIPSWCHDMRLSADIAAGSTILVQAIGLPALFAGNDRLDDFAANVFVWTDTGELYCRQVSSVSEEDGIEGVILSTDLPAIARQSAMVGFLYLARFMDDQISLNYQSRNHATAEISFRQVLET